MNRPGATPPFLDDRGRPLPNSIAKTMYLRLGGFEQWVMIRGADRSNPVLIFLHGGPGFSETRLFRHHNAALEHDFTVVYWDQRGSGKSFDPSIPRSSMTVEQFIRDLDELVREIQIRLGHDGKVTLFGHSWGSALGVLYAARHPEAVRAYVGSGQVGDWPAAEAASYAYALQRAEAEGERRLLQKLRDIGPPPHSAEALWTQRSALQQMDGNLTLTSAWHLGRIFLEGPEYSLLDLPGFFRGFRFSLDAMWTEVSSLNLPELVPALSVPVFFFLGRQDHWVPGEISARYFEALEAPSKRLEWFENSGHEPFVDEPDKFNALMRELVRPVA